MAYDPVRSLSRGLLVLEALNTADNITVGETAAKVGLPRGTVLRLFETLRLEGYVTRSEESKTYRLSNKVQLLGGGFDEEEWIATLAMPVLKEFSKTSLWPIGISTLATSGDRMYVRINTDTRNEMMLSTLKYTYYKSILGSAVGQVFLAFLEAKEQRAILEILASGSPYEDDQMAKNHALVKALLARIRKERFAISHSRDGKHSRVAVPIVTETEGVIASLAIRYFTSALSSTQAMEHFLGPLNSIAKEIGERVMAWQSGR